MISRLHLVPVLGGLKLDQYGTEAAIGRLKAPLRPQGAPRANAVLGMLCHFLGWAKARGMAVTRRLAAALAAFDRSKDHVITAASGRGPRIPRLGQVGRDVRGETRARPRAPCPAARVRHRAAQLGQLRHAGVTRAEFRFQASAGGPSRSPGRRQWTPGERRLRDVQRTAREPLADEAAAKHRRRQDGTKCGDFAEESPGGTKECVESGRGHLGASTLVE